MRDLVLASCGFALAAIMVWEIRRGCLGPDSKRTQLIEGALGGVAFVLFLLSLVIGDGSESWQEAAAGLGSAAFCGSHLLRALVYRQRSRRVSLNGHGHS